MQGYFDFHCHLDADQFDDMREDILVNLQAESSGCITVAVDMDSSRRAVAIAAHNPHVWASVGQHPVDNKTELFSHAHYQSMIDSRRDQIVCIGECGLDYYWLNRQLESGALQAQDLSAEKKRQELLFRSQIDLACANDLPLMLHVRSSKDSTDAHTDALAILSDYPDVRAVFHFFTEGPQLAEQIIAAGYYISLPGVITFAEMDETIMVIPLDRIFAETDSPYAAPQPYRGKTNQPRYVVEVYKKIAQVRKLELEDLRLQIMHNVHTFLGISL